MSTLTSKSGENQTKNTKSTPNLEDAQAANINQIKTAKAVDPEIWEKLQVDPFQVEIEKKKAEERERILPLDKNKAQAIISMCINTSLEAEKLFRLYSYRVITEEQYVEFLKATVEMWTSEYKLNKM